MATKKTVKKANPLLVDENESDVEVEVTPKPVKTKSGKSSEIPAAPVATAAVPNNADAALAGDAKRMKAILAKQPKIRMIIPLRDGEKPGSTEVCCINGYCQTIQKGVYVDLPEQMAEMIAENQNIELNLEGNKYRLDLDQGQDAANALA